ncbi:MAG: OmpA family protein [Deltaproteobacteria bacterium]|nr:OmpA family protein [Deltaproteobacteria bacterium]
MKKIITVCLAAAFIVTGCAEATKTQKGAGWGAAIGSVVGAGLGYAIGGKKGALIGAGAGLAAGGLTGAAIGKYMDNQERELRQTVRQADAVSIRRDKDILEITFKSDVVFKKNSAVLKTGAYSEIDRICSVLSKYPQCRIRLEGHTDSRGPEYYNKKLSLARAEAIKKALIMRNIAPNRLETIGMGEMQPIARNDSEGGRQMNRRVIMKIIPIQAQG